MSIKEFLELFIQIVEIDVDIRNNGRYNYKYVVGKHIEVYDGYKAPYKGYSLEDGERIDYNSPAEQFPASFIAIDPRELDKELLSYNITDIKVTKSFYSFLYGNPSGWSPLKAYITCDIGDGELKTKAYTPKVDIDKAQLTLEDFLEG